MVRSPEGMSTVRASVPARGIDRWGILRGGCVEQPRVVPSEVSFEGRGADPSHRLEIRAVDAVLPLADRALSNAGDGGHLGERQPEHLLANASQCAHLGRPVKDDLCILLRKVSSMEIMRK